MKQKLILAVALVFALALCACGSATENTMEAHTWRLQIVQSNALETAQDADRSVLAIGAENDAYPNAPVVALTWIAQDGTVSITDETNDMTYEGTYTKQDTSAAGTIYEVVIDGTSRYATVSMTESNGSETPTMTVNLGEYSVTFDALDAE